jgi:hypothetical protein
VQPRHRPAEVETLIREIRRYLALLEALQEGCDRSTREPAVPRPTALPLPRRNAATGEATAEVVHPERGSPTPPR